jgi:hypothetical protein
LSEKRLVRGSFWFLAAKSSKIKPPFGSPCRGLAFFFFSTKYTKGHEEKRKMGEWEDGKMGERF